MYWKRILTLAISLTFFTGCTKSSGPKNVLNLGNGTEPKDLDPHLTTGVPEHNIIQNLFEPLVLKDPITLEPTPGTAESWTISKDAKTYTFKLRPTAKWSNGDPVTAEDFVYSWRRLLDPKTAAEYAYQAFYIVGGKELNAGKLRDPSKLGVRALDPHTLEVKLVRPVPFFLRLLFHHSLTPVHRATIEKHGMRWTRPENMVNNGAFLLHRWQMNQVISLKPNPLYWNRQIVKLDQVNLYPIEKADTEEKMFRSKQLHATYDLPVEKIPYWKNDKSGVYQNHPYLGTYYYSFNVTKKPFTDKRVRKALTLAIDRKSLVENVLKAGQMPGTFFTPPGAGGFQPIPRLPADLSRLEEAKQLLKEAGYPGGKGLPKLEMMYNTSENHKKIAEAMQQMWKVNLGVEAVLYNQEWKVFLDSRQTGNFMLAREGWIGDYNDPNSFLDLFVTGGGNNHGRYSNAKYDALIEQASVEQDPQKRLQIFQQAEDILLEELPVLPLYIYTRNFLRDPRVEGWNNNVEDYHPLALIRLKE